MKCSPDLTSSTVESRLISFILIVSCLVAFWGCQSLPQTPDELAAYAQDPQHGLVQEKQVGPVRMRVQYRPTDLLVAQELPESREAEQIKALRAKYGQYAYFILSFSQDNQEALYQRADYGQFSETLQNLAFRMNRFTQLTTAQQDTIPLADFAYPRLYGHGSSTQVMLVFDREKIPDDDWVQLTVEDVGLGTGRQHFRFDIEQLHRAPTIDFINQ